MGTNDMTIRMVVTAIVVALIGPLPRATAAQEANPLSGQIAELKEATTLRCQFDRGGQTFEWREGMAMGMKTDRELVPVMFDQIDRRSGQAVRIVAVDPLTGNRWVENVDIFEFGWELRHEASATYGITFVAGVGDNRHVPIGHVGRFTGVSMTTIWSPVDEHSVLSHEWEYPAVFTQHMPLSADDLPSQHPGRCWIER
jgi:hypothetical protein